MAKRKIGEILWLALVCAKSEREGLIDAYGGDTKEELVRQAVVDVKAFERIQIRFFGTSKTELQTMMEKMTPISIFKLLDEEIEEGNDATNS